MKLASIVPMYNVVHTFEGSYAMLLAHLKDYYPECFNKNCYKIMDNSLIELGNAVSIKDVWEAGKQCKADEVILPDVFRDGKETFKAVSRSIEWLKKEGCLNEMRLMAVCQGNNVSDFELCFHALESLPEIYCIGIPKVATTLHVEGRPYFEYLWQKTRKQIHLLGCWDSLSEYFKYKNPQLIRSIDTCIPALNSICGADTWDKRPATTIDLLQDKLNMYSYRNIQSDLRVAGLL